ncbi:MAG: radical SAM protein [Planctomycetes bacterium]|nr:radical SAM protein [Planctomycetota bacterium]
MDVSIISTYRCSSKCSMCYVWKNPTQTQEEVGLQTLKKVPGGIDNLNITGGEPTLRADLMEVVEILHPKARKLEISTNGLDSKKIEPIIRIFPDIKIRFSLEGFGETNDRLRGEDGGFKKKVAGLKRLKELGGCDLGFSTVIQDDNAGELSALFELTQSMGVELATTTLHNAFQFHKSDNFPYDRLRVARSIEVLIVSMLKTNSLKNWFRAYLNLGLIQKVLGHERLMPCTAATDFLFIDPWADVYACNVRPDLYLGNLETQSWDEIYQGNLAQAARARVATCAQNCWMVGSARTAMRNSRFTRLPKFKPLWWVLVNKVRVNLDQKISFDRYIDYKNIAQQSGEKRVSYLGVKQIKRSLQHKDEAHYQEFGEFFNR